MADELSESWRLFHLCHEEHSRHEDQAIFKTYNEFFPGITQQYNDDHDGHHELLEKWVIISSRSPLHAPLSFMHDQGWDRSFSSLSPRMSLLVLIPHTFPASPSW